QTRNCHRDVNRYSSAASRMSHKHSESCNQCSTANISDGHTANTVDGQTTVTLAIDESYGIIPSTPIATRLGLASDFRDFQAEAGPGPHEPERSTTSRTIRRKSAVDSPLLMYTSTPSRRSGRLPEKRTIGTLGLSFFIFFASSTPVVPLSM